MAIVVDGERIEVIDAHTHMGISPALRIYGCSTDRYLAEEGVKTMDAAAVDQCIAFPCALPQTDYLEANKIIAEQMKRYPKRIIGFLRLNPNYGPQRCVEVLDYSVEKLGLRGLKLNPFFEFHIPNDEDRMFPIMERLRKHRVPLLYHCGEVWTASPALIADLASNFPDVNVIIAHIGIFDYGEDAIALARRTDNIFLESSTCVPVFVRKAVKKLGAERIVFGSDSPYTPMGWELDKIAKYSALSIDQLRLILAENLKRLLQRV